MFSHSHKLCAAGFGFMMLSCSSFASSSALMMLLPPSGVKDMHHMLVVTSCHPLMMVSPLNVISHPCEWKNTPQPASHDTDPDSRLFRMDGASCASLAAFGSLFKSSCDVLVVNMRGLQLVG